MSLHDSYQALGVITSLLCFASVLGAIYVMYSAIQIRKYIKSSSRLKHERPVFLTDYVFWMSCCDLFQQFYYGLALSSVGFDSNYNANWDDWICQTIAMIQQFCLVASATWNFLIAVCLLRILLGKIELYQFEKELKWHHLFVWSIALICCIIPWFGDTYGYVSNVEENYGFKQFQCWINHHETQLCLYAPIFIYVTFATFLLFVIIYRNRNDAFITNKKSKGKGKGRGTALRLSMFTVVFVVTWMCPFILRVRGIFSDKEAPAVLVWMHHIGFASIGLANAIIWGLSSSLKKQKMSMAESKMKSKSKSKSKSRSKLQTQLSRLSPRLGPKKNSSDNNGDSGNNSVNASDNQAESGDDGGEFRD